MNRAALEAVERVWLAQLRRSYPNVSWRLIREGEGTGRDSTATSRKRRQRHLAAPRDVDAGSDIGDADLPA